MTKLQELQKALDEFERKNYKGGSSVRMALGIVEECGELYHARFRFQKKKIKDAIADVIVFSMQLASFEGIDWEQNLNDLKKRHVYCDEDALGVQVGQLCHHILKREQGLGKREDHLNGIKKALCGIGLELIDIAGMEDIDWEQTFIKTVEGEILKRTHKKLQQRYIKSKGI